MFLVGLSIVVVLLNQNTPSLKAALRTTPTPEVKILHSLTLSPHNQIIQQDQINTVDIILETQKDTNTQPRLLQMEIAYDPTALFDVEVTPGDFFANPTVSLKTINTNTGRISYALEKTEADTTQKTTGIAARLTFLPNPSFVGRETSLYFLGKTIIHGTTEGDILTTTYGTKLFFATASAKTQ